MPFARRSQELIPICPLVPNPNLDRSANGGGPSAAGLLGELAFGDMGDDAEVRAGGLEEIGPVAGGEVTAIPGAAEQRGEPAGALAEA